MLRKLSFVFIAAFWVVMNVLLWRSQIGAGHDLVSSVPIQTVLEKVLTAPDDSTLAIIIDGRKIGYLRWHPVVGENGATDQVASGSEPEGMVEQITDYSLQLDGSFLLTQLDRTLKLGGEMAFNREFEWQNFRVEGSIRPMSWEIQGTAATRDLWVKAGSVEQDWVRRFTFEELRDPAPLIREMNLPMLDLLLGGAMPGTGGQPLPPAGPALVWEAYYDWLQIGRSRIRVYRVEARVLENIRMVVLVSRVGEILRVELPGEIRLINDALGIAATARPGLPAIPG